MKTFDLTGHCALVTGGTQGIGAAICRHLAAAGADVLVHGLIDDEAAQQVVRDCRAAGVNATLLVADLAAATPDDLQQLVDRAISCSPNIDLLVNNAGTYIDPPFLELTAEQFERTWRLNVAAGFFLTQACARRWVERGCRARVLFTSSINARLAEPDHVAYDTSKGAVEAMVRSLCVALAPHGIRVNALAPGLIRTPLTDRVLSHDPAILRWMQLHTPSGEVPAADVCGPTAVFLLSDAAEHIHGQSLLIDGGMSCWQQPDLPAALRGSLG
jgi:NAD(P)-dependent dehydrogenase (short-subunit alcohol dehydrogenase family)